MGVGVHDARVEELREGALDGELQERQVLRRPRRVLPRHEQLLALDPLHAEHRLGAQGLVARRHPHPGRRQRPYRRRGGEGGGVFEGPAGGGGSPLGVIEGRELLQVAALLFEVELLEEPRQELVHGALQVGLDQGRERAGRAPKHHRVGAHQIREARPLHFHRHAPAAVGALVDLGDRGGGDGVLEVELQVPPLGGQDARELPRDDPARLVAAEGLQAVLQGPELRREGLAHQVRPRRQGLPELDVGGAAPLERGAELGPPLSPHRLPVLLHLVSPRGLPAFLGASPLGSSARSRDGIRGELVGEPEDVQ
mmetsp:Transcript_41411/g.93306  ORF Transcript_41411/g.93306 Transcript_41411/m.93306 type:complete len:311 (+) Transcript_41411:1413-2345(+)